MKLTNIATAGLSAAALLLVGAAAAQAATPLTGRVALRPLTPSEITDYKLTGAQGANGMTTIGVGQPAYLDAQLNVAIPTSDIVSVTWDLTGKPVGSTAYLTNSPLGTNVPIYSPVDRRSFQVGGRTMLRPDVTGQYTVTATITTASNGSTNVSQTITAATFMGLNTCKLCHSGGLIADNIVMQYTNTGHATALARKLDDSTGHFGANCVSCHAVGYDANPAAVNGGFDDVAKQVGWTVPTVLTNGNWAKMPAALQNLGNVQCENCHGPGSEHAYSLGAINRISKTMNEGTCGQCHDAKTHHIKSPEWANSAHATVPNQTGASCARCHTAQGFADYASGKPAAATAFEAITCAACHDPHSDANPHQLRKVDSVALMDNKTTLTNASTSGLCMNCHMSRRDATNYVEVTAGSSGFGPHHGPQTDMFLGVNAITYGKLIPSSAHRDAITNACVTCHMQASPAATDPSFTHIGGHTFSLSYSNGTTNYEAVAACVKCHGAIKSFDIARGDFDGNGVIEGAQTEVKGLLNRLSLLLPPVGVAKPMGSLGAPAISISSSWTRQQLRAAYNYMFVLEDRSFGVHNLAYTVGLLKASIADLTGDGNNDGLPDDWQIQYFGSTSNPAAAPSAIAAGDGVPNWLKYSLGLDPTKPGIKVDGGVVWANGTVLKGGATNTVQIYTAAEVAFNTEAGKTYQLEAISSLGGGWQPVGAPIAGTGSAMSYVTPTRPNLQQFFRVSVK